MAGYLTGYLLWILRSLQMAVLEVMLLPLRLFWAVSWFVLSHIWALAITVAACTALAVFIRHWARSTRSSSKHAMVDVRPAVVLSEILKAVQVHPRNGWSLRQVEQSLRVFSRFFPVLSSATGSSILATTSVFDMPPKRALQLAINTSELPCWMPGIAAPVQCDNRHQDDPGKGFSPHNDVIKFTLRRDLGARHPVVQQLLSLRKRSSQWLEYYLPFLAGLLPTVAEFTNETIERSWQFHEVKVCCLLSVPCQPSSLPFHWSLVVFTPVPKQKDMSLAAIYALPKGGQDTAAVHSCVSQLCALREHAFMRELRMYSSGSNSPSQNHTLLSRERSSSGNLPLEDTHSKPASPETSKRDTKTEDLIPSPSPSPAPVPSSISKPPLTESDRRYIVKAEECAAHLVEAAKATEHDGWTSMGTNKYVTIMKKTPTRGGSPVSCVKGSTFVNAPPDFILRLLMGRSHACELDDMLKDLEEVHTVTESIHLLHLHYKAVWPTTARDFAVLDVVGRVDENISVHAAVSVVDPRIPEEKGFVRGEVISGGGYVIQACPGQPNRSHITYITQVDLKGSVPMFVVNKVIESQPMCAAQLRRIVETEYEKMKRNLQMLKELEERLPIYYIIPEKAPPSPSPPPSPPPPPPPLLPPALPLPPSASTSSLPVHSIDGDLLSNQEPPKSQPSSVAVTHSLPVDLARRRETPTPTPPSPPPPPPPPPPPSDGQPTDEAGPSSSSSSSSSKADRPVMDTPEEIPAVEEPPAVEDVFSSSDQPPLPLSTLLDKLPRYSIAESSSSGEDPSTGAQRTSSPFLEASLQYPRRENQIDYRTMGNQVAAQVLEEMFHISGLKLHDGSTFTDQGNGWRFDGVEKDVVVLKRKSSDPPVYSFIGKGIIGLPPQEVFNCIRNPNQRFIFDNMLKELHIVKQIEEGLYILHLHHETTQCFLKQSRDFCLLACERSEPNKKLVVGTSVEVPECPPQPNIIRGKVYSSGWVIEPFRRRGQLCTEITYIVQVDTGGLPSTLVNFVSRRQPLAVAYLREYLESTTVCSDMEESAQEEKEESSSWNPVLFRK